MESGDQMRPLNADAFVRGQLEALVSLSDDAIVARSLDGRVISWNAGAERLLGYTAEEMLGASFDAIVPRERIADTAALFERVTRGESIKQHDAVRVRKDGSHVDVRVDMAPIRDAAGDVIGVSLVARDMTELIRADELRHTFLRTVSHDVRSPLTAVLSAAKLLEDASRLEPEQRAEFSRMIVRNAHRIRRLLDDVLDIERLTDGGGFELERESVDVAGVVDEVLNELMVGSREIVVACEAPTIDVDRVLFERTLYNLIGNALKHTEGEVLVRTWRSEDGAVLAVEDRGPGVPNDCKDDIFRPFTRGTEEHVPGTGVGLSLVAAFARAHGGRAWVEDRDGGGSSFRVFFSEGE